MAASRRTRKVSAVGTKAQVFHGTAEHTSGGLKKKDLMKTKRGRIVSRRKHAVGLRRIKTLRRMGFVAKKGKFQLFTRKSRGGATLGHAPVEDISGNHV